MTVFMELLPEFFSEGRLHWLHAPLYSTTKGKITKFYFTEKEFKERPKNSGVVHRMKGLGAMDKEESEIALFGKEQRLEQILPGAKHSVLLKDLMGKSVLPRKRFIEDKMDFEKIRLGGI